MGNKENVNDNKRCTGVGKIVPNATSNDVGQATETPRNPKVIHPFFNAGENVKTLAIFCIKSPSSFSEADEDQKCNSDDLFVTMKKQQFICFNVMGKYENFDYYVTVYNISLNDAKFYGCCFKQDFFIFTTFNQSLSDATAATFSCYQKHNSNSYKLIEDTKDFVKDTADDDCFTAIFQNLRLRLSSKIFEKQINFINNLVTERCKNSVYRNSFRDWLNESISSEYAQWARRIRRAKLWGEIYLIAII